MWTSSLDAGVDPKVERSESVSVPQTISVRLTRIRADSCEMRRSAFLTLHGHGALAADVVRTQPFELLKF
jgi:hypothetical protein